MSGSDEPVSAKSTKATLRGPRHHSPDTANAALRPSDGESAPARRPHGRPGIAPDAHRDHPRSESQPDDARLCDAQSPLRGCRVIAKWKKAGAE